MVYGQICGPIASKTQFKKKKRQTIIIGVSRRGTLKGNELENPANNQNKKIQIYFYLMSKNERVSLSKLTKASSKYNHSYTAGKKCTVVLLLWKVNWQ